MTTTVRPPAVPASPPATRSAAAELPPRVGDLPVADTETAVTAVAPPAVAAPRHAAPHQPTPTGDRADLDTPAGHPDGGETDCAGFPWQQEGPVGRLWLTGELDRARGRQVGAALDDLVADPGLREVTVDLTAVTLLDTVTPRVLLRAHWRLERRGGRLRVLSGSGQARRVVRWYATEELLRP